MSFTDEQRRSLSAKLKRRHVKTRPNHGGTISYVEGWHVIAEANRIFGYDCWDRRTVSPRCAWSGTQSGQVAALYTAKVQITVRAGGEVIVREGIGAGFGRGPTGETAHEIALKAAETDATKRALATFGNPFGLALYDKTQTGVTRPPRPKQLFALYQKGSEKVEFATPRTFLEAALTAIRGIHVVDELYAFWHRNRATLESIKTLERPGGGERVETLIAALKARARILGHRPKEDRQDGDDEADPARQGQLAFPKLKRLRNKEHLKYVARQPCLICGRRPTHAHHVRYAQSRAFGAKVSDEFTVPLCSMHHDAVHRTGNELGWWVAQAIDPLKTAAQLWATTNGRASAQDQGDIAASNAGVQAETEGTNNAVGGIEEKPTLDRPSP